MIGRCRYVAFDTFLEVIGPFLKVLAGWCASFSWVELLLRGGHRARQYFHRLLRLSCMIDAAVYMRKRKSSPHAHQILLQLQGKEEIVFASRVMLTWAKTLLEFFRKFFRKLLLGALAPTGSPQYFLSR